MTNLRSPPMVQGINYCYEIYMIKATLDVDGFTNTFPWAKRFGVAGLFILFLQEPTFLIANKVKRQRGREPSE